MGSLRCGGLPCSIWSEKTSDAMMFKKKLQRSEEVKQADTWGERKIVRPENRGGIFLIYLRKSEGMCVAWGEWVSILLPAVDGAS